MTWVMTGQGAEEMPNVLASHSLNEEALLAHVALYRTIMFGESGCSATRLKLTLRPTEMTPGDLAALRAAGLSDRDIVDANQVASYFNYVNRVADGLGVELEDSCPRCCVSPAATAWASS